MQELAVGVAAVGVIALQADLLLKRCGIAVACLQKDLMIVCKD